MLRYFFKRLLLAVPTLLLISLFTFGLSKCAPFDPVRATLGESLNTSLDPDAMSQVYARKARLLKADLPDFYFTLTTAIFPDTLWKIFPPERRERLYALTAQTANWPAVARYETAMAESLRAVESMADSLPQKSILRGDLSLLLQSKHPDEIVKALQNAQKQCPVDASVVQDKIANTLGWAQSLLNPQHSWKRWLPSLRWNGWHNQYHRWLSAVFTGDWGTSISGRPVWAELQPRLYTTLTINGLAYLLAFLLAIPLGVWMARLEGRAGALALRYGLLLLFSIPIFWLGSMLMYFFATAGHGFYWIKSIYADVWHSRSTSFLSYLFQNASRFVLPVLTLSLHTLAILTLQMRGGVLQVMGLDYIRTARAKGVSESGVYWRHAFPNALFPMITLFAGIFPAVFSGSIIVEYLFQFPGIGMKTQDAFVNRDYPVLFAILMMASFLTVFGNIIGDMLYAWVDPRVRFDRK